MKVRIDGITWTEGFRGHCLEEDIFDDCHHVVLSMSTNNHSNFHSNTSSYLLWISCMFRYSFGPSSGYLITLLEVEVQTATQIYTSFSRSHDHISPIIVIILFDTIIVAIMGRVAQSV